MLLSSHKVKEWKLWQKLLSDGNIFYREIHPIEEIAEDTGLSIEKIKTALDHWVTFLTKAHCLDTANLPKELDDPCIKKAMDVLKVIHLSQKERTLYNAHLDLLRIEESILSKAESKGIEKGRRKSQS